MKIIGITGSIGMGKTTVSSMIKDIGYKVFEADREVAKLFSNNEYVKNQLVKNFGDVLCNDGNIDKQKLSKIVFFNEEAFGKLESITHPEINKEIRDFINDGFSEFEEIIFVEAAILFEVGWDKYCDFVIVVNTNYDNQRKRVLDRPNMTDEKFHFLLNKQIDNVIKCNSASFVISTSGTMEETEVNIRKIINLIVNSDSILLKN